MKFGLRLGAAIQAAAIALLSLPVFAETSTFRNIIELPLSTVLFFNEAEMRREISRSAPDGLFEIVGPRRLPTADLMVVEVNGWADAVNIPAASELKILVDQVSENGPEVRVEMSLLSLSTGRQIMVFIANTQNSDPSADCILRSLLASLRSIEPDWVADASTCERW